MGAILKRKCAHCKKPIEIDMDNIHDVVCRNGFYYHKTCLIELATKKVQTKRGKWTVWQDILNDIEYYEKEAKALVEYYLTRDRLNVYLIETYDIVTVPARFFQVVADLYNGQYRQKRCKPITVVDLLDAWKWGQHNLDKINIDNKMKGVGPKNDTERIMYDLAIVVRTMPQYLEYKSKMAVATSSAASQPKQDKIDYTVISQSVSENKENDILDLLDEMF